MQEVIGRCLGSLDDKIELNRRMNETLEAMAQAIFRDWFVDFGPVRRKLEGAGDPVAIMGGLTSDPDRAAALAALFPDTLGDDGLPEGWPMTTLADYAQLNPESWTGPNHPNTIRYVDLSDIKWGLIGDPQILMWSNAPSRARRVAREGDTLVGTVRPGNGSYAYVNDDGLTASTGFAQLRPNCENQRDFVYLAATLPENIERLTHLADGAAYPAVNPSIVLATEVPLSPRELTRAFSRCVGPLRARAEHAKQEKSILAETRDYLLPKLMSGQVRVRAAEAIATAVA